MACWGYWRLRGREERKTGITRYSTPDLLSPKDRVWDSTRENLGLLLRVLGSKTWALWDCPYFTLCLKWGNLINVPQSQSLLVHKFLGWRPLDGGTESLIPSMTGRKLLNKLPYNVLFKQGHFGGGKGSATDNDAQESKCKPWLSGANQKICSPYSKACS